MSSLNAIQESHTEMEQMCTCAVTCFSFGQSFLGWVARASNILECAIASRGAI